MIEPPDEVPRRTHPIPDGQREEMVSMPSRCSLDKFLDWCLAEGVPADAMLHGGIVSWVRQETDAEQTRREQWQAEREARTEEWERRKYAELKAKFEPALGQPSESALR